MSTETGELAIPAAHAQPAARRPRLAGLAPSSPTFPRFAFAPAHVEAVKDTWRALWASRLLVWVAGSGAVAALGLGPTRKVLQHASLTRGFGWLGDVLVAPATRWDAGWYLLIARQGYKPALGAATAPRSAFFPLYPLLVRALSALLISPVLAGVLVAVLALAVALYGLHRLTALEVETGVFRGVGQGCAEEVARLAVMVCALSPMAFFFSAIYSESLYMALSIGVFWCARKGHWTWTGVLGAAASATRPTGALLAVPALILYLYGPRQDRPPDRAGRGSTLGTGGVLSSVATRLRTRYRVRKDLLWLAVMPLGLGLFATYLALAGGDPAMPFHSQQLWGRQFVGPFAGVWQGAVAAFDGLRQLLSYQGHHSYFAQASGTPLVSASHNVLLFAFALAGAAAVAGVLRRLPVAYGAYVLLALALPLSDPVSSEPLMSLPRFLLVLFPLSIWLAGWLADHPRARLPVLTLSAVSLAFFTGAFATWHWVA
jgi:hypothetical protein